jgi:hypothetical protein
MDLGTASPHPEVAAPEILLPIEMRLWSNDRQILENLFVVSYRENANSVSIANEVFNWRSGKSVLVCNSEVDVLAELTPVTENVDK